MIQQIFNLPSSNFQTHKQFGRTLALGALAAAVLISCSPVVLGGGGQTDVSGILSSDLGDLQPPFDAAVLTGYEIEAPAGTSQIVFYYNETAVPDTQVSGSISSDENLFTITLETGREQKIYEVTVIVMPAVDINAITLSADDFEDADAIIITSPADKITQSAPFASTPPDINVAFTLADSSAAVTYTGDFAGWSGTSNTIAVAINETKTGDITVNTVKTIANRERAVSKVYALSISRPGYQAEGGTIQLVPVSEGKYDEVHVFTNPTDMLIFSKTPYITNASLLVVAGGGGGGSGLDRESQRGGGGGAGGLVYYDKDWTLNQLSYTIVVGAGGTKATDTVTATSGSDSKFGTTVAAIGGGWGSSYNLNAGGGGGSGGGGSNRMSGGSAVVATLPVSKGVHSFGNPGGSVIGDREASASGGGGAGALPGNIYMPGKGNSGGTGKKINIEEAGETWYAAGGNAGNITSASADGCPTAAGATASADAQDGAPYTGNGGGGGYTVIGSATRANGGNGGSGIVVVRFPFNY